MVNWKETYEVFLKLDKSELYEQGKKASSLILAYLQTIDSFNNAALVLLSIVASFVKADRNVSENEYEMFLKVTNIDSKSLSYLDFKDLLDNYDKSDIALNDELIDSLHNDIKLQVIILGLVMAAIDGKITNAEQKIIEKFYN